MQPQKIKNKLKFDAKTHRYSIKIKSVSQVINDIYGWDYGEVPKDILEMAVKRGVCIHNNIEATLIKERDAWWLKNECVCKVNGINSHNRMLDYFYDKVLEVMNDNIDLHNIKESQVEQPLIAIFNGLIIAGTPDFWYIDDLDRLHLFDWKTSQKNKDSYRMQLYLYAEMIKTIRPEIKEVFASVINLNNRDTMLLTGYEPEIKNKLEAYLNV